MRLTKAVPIALLVLLFVVVKWPTPPSQPVNNPTLVDQTPAPPISNVTPISTEPTTPASIAQPPIPSQATIDVPFTSQAPHANWDLTHEDTCEEASLIMVKHFLDHTTIGAASDANATSATDAADQEILDLVQWEETHDYGPSITLEQLAQVARDYYNLNNGQVKTASIDSLKKDLAAGHPLILGMAGRLLHNPNFSNGGPNYHMLVAIGYDKTGIITNDPGTRNGQSYRYDNKTFFEAIHNWDATDILKGAKEYLVFK